MLIKYANEKEFKELEHALEKQAKPAYDELENTHLPNLRAGKLKNAVRNGDVYEIPLRKDKEFSSRTHDNCKLVFKIEDDAITLLSIEPQPTLLWNHPVWPDGSDMFKINLF